MLSILRTCCPERTTPQTRGDVLRRQGSDSSRGQVVIAICEYLAVICHLPDNLSIPISNRKLKVN
jgi:hypothetical protein